MKRLWFVAVPVLALVLTLPVTVAAQKADKAQKPRTVTGMVKSVSGNSLTISASGKDMTFTVDGQTKFVGKGLTTKSTEKGGKISPSDAVAVDDRVTVTYHDVGGTMHASDVRIVSKGSVKK